jgi:PKD repeat protein/pimeloyl-ACP methyl ester carboxylesterase
LNGARVRSCASLSCNMIGSAFNGDTGTVIDGPVSADGYTWWRIDWDDPSVATGWMVEWYAGDCLLAPTSPPPPPPAPPPAPDCLEAQGKTDRVSIGWCDNVRGHLGYKIQRKIGSSGTWQLLKTTGPSVHEYDDFNVVAGNTYFYRVCAYNNAGDSPFTNETWGALRLGSYTVTTSSSPAAGGTTTGRGTYQAGTQITVSATPNPGYSFDRWSENGIDLPFGRSFNLTVNSDSAFIAHFRSTSTNPKINRVRPNPAPGSWAPVRMTISGSGFQPGATVTWRDETHNEPYPGRSPASPTTPTEILIDPVFGPYDATWSAQVINPDGGKSERQTFAVQVQAGETGALRGYIEPSGARQAGARWRRAGTSTWRASGEEEAGIKPGTYNVEFSNISGWHTPTVREVRVAANLMATATGTYQPHEPAGEPRFEFSHISSPQMPGKPFRVTIDAVDSNGQRLTWFSGRIALDTTGGSDLNRTSVTATQGRWTGDVVLNSESREVQLHARSSDMYGTSNAFRVGQGILFPGTLIGLIKHRDDLQVIASGDVVIRRDNVEVKRVSVLGGHFSAMLEPGCYTVDFEHDNYFMVEPTPITIRSLCASTINLAVEKKAPAIVLLVPGMMGSTTQNPKISSPFLPKANTHPVENLSLQQARGLWALLSPFSYSNMWTTLQKALGAQDEFEVIDVPYDWRLPVEEAAELYFVSKLQNAMDAFREEYGQDEKVKVHVVAHSMGGLVVRSYIQGLTRYPYENEIDKLVLVGSPAGGSAIPYYIWDGGNPEAADNVQGSSLYNSTIEAQMDVHKEDMERIWDGKYRNATDVIIQKFVQDFCPSLGQLMYMERFLNYNGKVHYHPDRAQGPMSTTYTLGTDPNRPALFTKGSDSRAQAGDRVRTWVFASNSEETLLDIYVAGPQPGSKIYPHGTPTGDRINIDGDKTVTTLSTRWGINQYVEDFSPKRKGSHTDLMNIYASEITQCLLPEGAKLAPVPIVKEDAPEVIFAIGFYESAQPYLVGPDGRAIGLNPDTGEFHEDLPGAEIGIGSQNSDIVIESPPDGVYNVYVRLTPGQLVRAGIEYRSESAFEEQTFRLLGGEDPVHFKVIIDSAADPVIRVESLVAPPQDLMSERHNDATRLTWTAAKDSNAAEYRIYGQQLGHAWFELLGVTTENFFEPAHSWSQPEGDDRWRYVVISADADGTEGLVHEAETNWQNIVALFDADVKQGPAPLTVSFTDLSTGSIDAWHWDLNGDDEPDTFVKNPQWTYEEPGWYSISLTVSGPQGTHVKHEVQYIQVEPAGPWGTFSANVEPIEAAYDGAQWSIDNGDTWHSAGEIIMLPAGEYTVIFRDADGWPTAQTQRVVLENGDKITVTGLYEEPAETGSLKVDIKPQAAVDAGAQWRVDYGHWQASGATVSNLSAGEHTVSFRPLEGWSAPDDMSVIVSADKTTTATGTYTIEGAVATPKFAPSPGKYSSAQSVAITCATPGATIRYTVDGSTPTESSTVYSSPVSITSTKTLKAKAWKSGMTASGVQSGDYIIGDALELVAVSVSAPPGSQVDVPILLQTNGKHPSAITMRVDFDSTLLELLDVVAGPSASIVGKEVMFNDVPSGTVGIIVSGGTTVMADGDLLLLRFRVAANAALGETAYIAGAELSAADPQAKGIDVAFHDGAVTVGTGSLTGSLKVTIEPLGARNAGAQWRRTGTSMWRNSGSTETNVPQGAQTVEFKSVSGWNKPANMTAVITPGQTTTLSGKYGDYASSGSLRVIIEPLGARNARAQWRRTGTSAWFDSGSTERNVTAGTHTVEFKIIPGWNAPNRITVNVPAGGTGAGSGTYTTKTSSPGGCNLSSKALQPFAETPVYEPALPSVTDANGLRGCATLAPLAIRLRSNETIDTATIWGMVTWGEAESADITWLPLDEADGWAVYQPETPWADGEVITFTAGAYTISGAEIGTFTYEFLASDTILDETTAVIGSDATAQQPEFVGNAYEVVPGTVYFEPLTIQLPVPEGLDASTLEPAYLFNEGGESRWVAGTRVLGWIEPDSVCVMHDTDGVFIEFQARHGGIVQLRRCATDTSSAELSNAGINGDLLLFFALSAFLLYRTRRVSFRRLL